MTREDLIRRGDALDACSFETFECYQARKMIRELPSADRQKGEWVPCSERLPDVGQDVLFCDSEWTEEGCLRADGDWWQFRWSSVMPKEKVTAWMPLPKPYREESEK